MRPDPPYQIVKQMSVRGKKKDDWVARTLCDYGDKTRKDTITHHFSEEAAFRSFEKINNIYGKEWRCWQEARDGRIINDNNYGG
jgi:hypothetical protein